MDYFTEMSAEQRRQLVDAQQVFGAWRPPFMELGPMGSLTWVKSKTGVRYLYRKVRGSRKSLGRETADKARLKDEEAKRKPPLKRRVRDLEKRMDIMAPVNRAIGIGRMPTIAARILRELDRETLLGSHIIVAGTNALYAYEAASGTIIQGSFVATDDADLLWDTKQSLLLTATGVRRDGLMGILRRVDKTFSADYGMNATNSKGYIVDLICPESEDFTTMKAGADIEATAMTGAEWLLASPQMEETIVGADGHSLRIVVPEPRTYALHKHWLSERQDRKPAKRPRDRQHAIIVAKLCKTYFGVAMDVKQMPWLPKELKAHIKPLTAEARAT